MEKGELPLKQRLLENQILRDYYLTAINRGVIDRSILEKYPLNDGEVVPNDMIEKYKSIFPISRVNVLLGKPGTLVGCAACTVGPGTPYAEPVGSAPIPKRDEAKSASLHPLNIPFKVDDPDSQARLKFGRREEPFNPVGFLEVVRIEMRNGSQLESCTGTLISSTIVLTAAHCVPKKLEDISSLSVSLPKENESRIRECNDSILRHGKYLKSCVDFSKGNLENFSRHKDYQEPNANQPAINDVAIIRLKSSTSVNSIGEPTHVSLSVNLPKEITIAGYGKSSTTDRNVELIEVGWNSGVVWAGVGGDFKYDPKIAGESGSCEGDSGGPVFEGKVFGYDKPPVLKLVAVVSAGNPDKSRPKCDSAYWISTTHLSDPNVRKWLCEQDPISLLPYCTAKIAEIN